MAKIGIGTKTGAFFEGLLGGLNQRLAQNQELATKQYLQQKELESQLALQAARTQQERDQLLWKNKHGFEQTAAEKLAEWMKKERFLYDEDLKLDPYEQTDLNIEEALAINEGKNLQNPDTRAATIRQMNLEDVIDPSRILTKEMIEDQDLLRQMLQDKGYMSPEQASAGSFSSSLMGLPFDPGKVYDDSRKVATLEGEGYVPYWMRDKIIEALASKAEKAAIGAYGIGGKDKEILDAAQYIWAQGNTLPPDLEKAVEEIYGVDVPSKIDTTAKKTAEIEALMGLGVVEPAAVKRQRNLEARKAATDYEAAKAVDVYGKKLEMKGEADKKKGGGKTAADKSKEKADYRDKMLSGVYNHTITAAEAQRRLRERGYSKEGDGKRLNDQWKKGEDKKQKERKEKKEDEDKDGKSDTLNLGRSNNGAPKTRKNK